MFNWPALRKHLRRSWTQWLLATAVFFCISLFYMGPAITSCSTTTTAFASDSTGGLAWFQWASGNHLSWGHTDKSNYPIGESLNRPQFIASEAFYAPYRVLSTLTTPICGLNLMLLLGYVSSALLMFGLIKWLFGRTAIAYFAGYAAAFVPFHQLKAQSHVVYASASIFIAIIWVYLWFLQRPTYKRTGLLAAVSAVGIYIDGYFVLFTSLLLACLIFFSLTPRLLKNFKKFIKDQWRYFAYFLGLFVILGLPVLYTEARHGGQISSTLAAVRSPIRIEQKNYGARPIEFLLPAISNPLLPASYSNWRAHHQHGSNSSEDTLYVGFTVLILATLAVVVTFWKRTKGLMLKENISYRSLVLICCGSALTLSLFALPYKYSLARVLVKLTDNWRVLSRFFLVIDPLLIILAAAGIYILVRRWPRHFYLTFMALLTGLLFCEYLVSPLRPHGDLYKDSPAIYQTIARDSSVKVIAEYPMIDLNDEPLTFTYAEVHGKDLINANDSNIGRDSFHAAIAGLHDKQTLGVLKTRGADLITTLGFDETYNPDLVGYFTPNVTAPHKGPLVFVYRIGSNVPARAAVLETGSGFSALSVDPTEISHRVLTTDGTMNIQKLINKPASVYNASFEAGALQAKPTNLTVSQNGKILWHGTISHTLIEITASADAPITLVASAPIDITNMVAQ